MCVLGMLGPASSRGRTDEQPSGQVKDGDMVTSSLDTHTTQHNIIQYNTTQHKTIQHTRIFVHKHSGKYKCNEKRATRVAIY